MAVYYRDFKNIVIDGGSRGALYERSVVDQLNRLWATWTGWSVLRAIIDTGKVVRIVPYSAADVKAKGHSNAYARPVSGRDARPLGAKAYAGGINKPDTLTDERFGPTGLFSGVGTGRGSDSEVHFSAEEFEAKPTCSKSVTSNCLPAMYAQNTGPDDILVHELVHALREMRGQLLQVPTRSKLYDNQEEFFAIVVQNVYGSEKGLTILRNNHHGNSALANRLATSEKFLGKGMRPITLEELENRGLLRQFVRENGDLCQNILRHVRAAFNPISELMRSPTEYPANPLLMYPERK